MIVADLSQRFQRLYRRVPRIYRAPGRLNLIGEHTDYNQGFVMPLAIDFATWVAIAPRSDRIISLCSENRSDTAELDLDGPPARGSNHWSDYAKGVAVMMERSGLQLRGADMLVHGEVPIGSGLSSSAALEVASGYALLENSGLAVDRLELARICQRAENEFVGMRCGLMDQFVSCFGQAGQALLLDCRSLEYKLLPLPGEVVIVVCNTKVRHELASSEYNVRRAECEEGVRLLAQWLPQVRSLRDVTMAELSEFETAMPPAIYKRCHHVVSENDRVIAAASALEKKDLTTFGDLLRESHRSLRDDFEVSCEELDLLVELAQREQGAYGARMMGGGFGGCTVNLVQAQSVASFKVNVAQDYEKATGRAPEIYVCTAAQGVERVL
jgi:galactokinase